MNWYEEVRDDILRYREMLKSMLGDVYALKPELAPRLHQLVSICNSVLAITSKWEEEAVGKEERERLAARVNDLKNLTEQFLQELSEAVSEEGNEEEIRFKAAAS